MGNIKPTADKLDLLEKLSERAEKESLKKLLGEIKTDVQLLDAILSGLHSFSTSVGRSTLSDAPSITSPGCSPREWLLHWELEMRVIVGEEGLRLFNQKVDAKYPLKTDK